jgi:hypothetical protein
VEEILENYGIDSETDVSVLDPDDLSKLVSSGIKTLDVKKLEHWYDSVCVRADHMLTSSLNTPASTGLVGSEELTVMTVPAHSTVVVKSLSDNDSERDGQEEDDVSDNDLEILGEQSVTADTTNSTGDASGGTESPVKKTKTILTEDQGTFAKMFLPTPSKINNRSL